jgi:hypothetical protein
MSLTRRFRYAFEDGDAFTIILPFDPRAVFGKARAPVVVTINGHSYRSTVAHMGGPPFIPLRKSNRAAAGIAPGAAIEVTLMLDEEVRTVALPEDLAAALAALPGGQAAWEGLSFTAQREQVEAITGAKKPETRARRLEKVLEMVRICKLPALGAYCLDSTTCCSTKDL